MNLQGILPVMRTAIQLSEELHQIESDLETEIKALRETYIRV